MKPDLVLIDDDELIRATWSWMSQKNGHRFLCLSEFKDFDFSLPKDVPVYVDYLFKDEPKGTGYAAQLIAAGFQHVFIATGLPENAVNAPAGLQAVVDKTYPL